MRFMLATILTTALTAVGQAPPSLEVMAPPTSAPIAAPVSDVNTGIIGSMIRRASPGDTLHILPGIYREHIRIDKPLVLLGGGAAVIDGGGNGDIVEIAAPDVTFKGFTVRNTGISLDMENAGIRASAPRAIIESNTLDNILFGIDLRESPGSVIRDNRIGGKDLDIARRGDGIRLWRCDGAVVEGNTIHDGRDAVLWYSRGITVRGNTSLRCRYGLHLMYSDDVVLEDNHLEYNSVGVYLMYSKGITARRNHLVRNRGPSGYGIGLKETDRYTIENNLIVGNRVGIYLDGSPFTTDRPGVFDHNTVAYNDIGITFLPAVRGNQLSQNNFIDNFEQVSVSGRGELTGNMFWKGDIGNFWTDYVGYDQNHDGVGDFVHESFTLFENLMDREPKLRILLFSPTQQAIEMVGRAMPAIRPAPKFTDEVPLMRPAIVDAGPAGPGIDRAGLTLSALFVFTIGGALLWGGRRGESRAPAGSAATALGGVK